MDGFTAANDLVHFIHRVGQECEFVTVRDIVAQFDLDETPCRPLAAITVDDGYEDFYSVALPILIEQGIPATLFATAGFVDGRCWLWWDAIRYLIDRQPNGKLYLQVAGEDVSAELAGTASRQAAWSMIADLLVTKNEERNQVIAQLETSAQGALPAQPIAKYAPMSWSQLSATEDAGIEIGCHTMTHAFLPTLENSALQHELVDAKQLLECHLRSPVTTFAYPNGMHYDVTPSIAQEVRAVGFSAALLAYPRRFRRRARYQLGRWSACLADSSLGNIVSGASIIKMELRL
jgi:peptidoglycan/xylan/chitin deacetylase (PgdA/CDA1 family)